MSRSGEIAGARLPSVEHTPIGELMKVLREGACGGSQPILYMLTIQKVEELEAEARTGKLIQGSDGLLLSLARELRV